MKIPKIKKRGKSANQQPEVGRDINAFIHPIILWGLKRGTVGWLDPWRRNILFYARVLSAEGSRVLPLNANTMNSRLLRAVIDVLKRVYN